jgi:hypothetical protein
MFASADNERSIAEPISSRVTPAAIAFVGKATRNLVKEVTATTLLTELVLDRLPCDLVSTAGTRSA